MTDWLEAQILRREAERDLSELLPTLTPLSAILQGEAQPVDAAEAVVLAKLFAAKQLDAASTRLWEQAFAAEPALAEDLKAAHRYNAACVAALAGCGQGRDDPQPDDAARARLRRQALAWLQADLRLHAERPEIEVAEVRGALESWTRDPDLAGVRDPDALDRLPEDERAAWRALWAEVDRLLQRAEGTP